MDRRYRTYETKAQKRFEERFGKRRAKMAIGVVPTPFPIYDKNGVNINPGCRLDEKGRVIIED